jgi:hypothetical protein
VFRIARLHQKRIMYTILIIYICFYFSVIHYCFLHFIFTKQVVSKVRNTNYIVLWLLLTFFLYTCERILIFPIAASVQRIYKIKCSIERKSIVYVSPRLHFINRIDHYFHLCSYRLWLRYGPFKYYICSKKVKVARKNFNFANLNV